MEEKKMRNRAMIIVLCTLFVCITLTNGEINDTKVSGKDDIKPKQSDDVCLTPACIHSASRILRRMNSSAKPCDDFYEFACGNFVKSAIMPNDYFKLSSFTQARIQTLARLEQIIEGIDESNAPKHFRLVKTFYKNCLKSATGWTNGTAQMTSAFQKIRSKYGWPLADGPTWNVTKLQNAYALLSLFGFTFGPDMKNNTVRIIHLDEHFPPLGRNYLKEGFSNEAVQAYYNYMIDIAKAFGFYMPVAKVELAETLRFEIELYQVIFPKLNYHDIYNKYTRTNFKELEQKFPNLPFTKLFPYPDDTVLQVNVDMETMARVEKWISGKSKRALANWMAWREIAPKVRTFGDSFVHRTDVFDQMFYGMMGTETLSDICIRTTEKALGFALEVLYQREYISQGAIDDLVVMFDNIKQQYSEFIEKAEWLGVETKRHALEKVSNIKNRFATCRELISDDELETFYRDLELSDGSYPDTLQNITKFAAIHVSNRSRCETIMVNTAYSYWFNSIKISEREYTDFFYDIDRPNYLNYGAAGFILGHEISHSLTVRGRYYDKNANLNPWWDSESDKTYTNHSQCFVEQFNNYAIDEFKMPWDSVSTQGENVADSTGIKTAYYAYLKLANARNAEEKLPGLDYSPKQMFWINMASSACTKYRPEKFKSLIYDDEHPPAKYRVNGPLSNMQEFSNDFKCDVGTKMNPVKKCSLW